MHICITTVQSWTGPYGPVQLFLGQDRTAVPECWTVRSGLFIGLHFQMIKRPDRSVRSSIFGTELQSGGAGPYSPVFLNGLQNWPRSGPDRTVASLTSTIMSICTLHQETIFCKRFECFANSS